MNNPQLVHELILKQSKRTPYSPNLPAPNWQTLSYLTFPCWFQTTASNFSFLGNKTCDRVEVAKPDNPQMASSLLPISVSGMTLFVQENQNSTEQSRT